VFFSVFYCALLPFGVINDDDKPNQQLPGIKNLCKHKNISVYIKYQL